MDIPNSRRLLPWLLAFWAGAGQAEPFTGTLVAERDCPATVAIKRPDNPGAVSLSPGVRYRVIGRNKAEATHYLLRIEDVQPVDRWVAATCGRLEDGPRFVATDPPRLGRRVAPRATQSLDGQFLLAASWQPAFCERNKGPPECRNESQGHPQVQQFSLHGLWPQPIGNVYCGVDGRERARSESGDWRRLPAPALDGDTRLGLAQRMPGVLSHLDRHQWIKHGTCYGTDADSYFNHSMALLDELNASGVRDLFESNLGRRLRVTQVRDAFDRDFGAGAGGRVRLVCDEEGLITELRIGLRGPIDPNTPLRMLILAAPPRTPGCPSGLVDRAGSGR